MNYLSFQPAFDVFHAEFRLLRLRRIMSADSPWYYEQLRIADFYLLFFFRLHHARLSPKHRALKKLSRESGSVRYEQQPDDRLLFNRMEKIQLAAIGTLISKGFFEREFFGKGLVVETEQQEPEHLLARIEAANAIDTRRLEAIQTLIDGYDLLGPDGLKARTGLLEHRYDAV